MYYSPSTYPSISVAMVHTENTNKQTREKSDREIELHRQPREEGEETLEIMHVLMLHHNKAADDVIIDDNH